MPKALPNTNLRVRLVRTVQKAVAEPRRAKNSGKAAASGTTEVYLSPTTVALFSFDEDYLKRLQERDPETEAHFYAYFTPLLYAKLKKHGLRHQDVQDIRQDTFRTALEKIRAHEVKIPARLGAYIHGICSNLIKEYYRRDKVHETIHQDGFDVPGTGLDPQHTVEANENTRRVRQVLAKMPNREREIITALFIEERDKDEICREHHVGREYLRVLVCRALKLARVLYLNP